MTDEVEEKKANEKEKDDEVKGKGKGGKGKGKGKGKKAAASASGGVDAGSEKIAIEMDASSFFASTSMEYGMFLYS